MTTQPMEVWLLASDPAIRWQVMRDLLEAEPSAVQAERVLVARKGWGAALLSQQTDSGLWQGDDAGLLRTTHCLVMLKELGVLPQDEDVLNMLDKVSHIKWEYHGHRPFFEGEVEACMNGKVLAVGSYFGIRCDVVLERLLEEQKADGGWNCVESSARASFHSTLAVLEGLTEYALSFGSDSVCRDACDRAQEYLLQRKLLRRLSTGEVVDTAWTYFRYPHTWHYDALWALDYFRAAGNLPDERMDEAIEFVRLRRCPDGCWPVEKPYPKDLLRFDMETEVGSASRWNTLRALRVLTWYDSGSWQGSMLHH